MSQIALYLRKDLNLYDLSQSILSRSCIPFHHLDYILLTTGLEPATKTASKFCSTIELNELIKAKVTRTLIITVMSSILYQLSYSL